MLFIGREQEFKLLEELRQQDHATIAIVYGRRRAGKTTLIEEVFKDRKLLKFEGVEGKNQRYQIRAFVEQLSVYFNEPTLKLFEPSNWRQVFELLAKYVTSGTWTVYLEELQWMAEYKSDLIAELKIVWDNQFSKNKRLILILCGSSPSFFLTEVIRSRSLHNRSEVELRLEQFPIHEACEFLPKWSTRSIFDAYLTVGGIPLYLSKLKSYKSAYLGICQHSFRKDSFFQHEFEKVFVSSFGKSETYRRIVEYIGQHRRCTRKQIGAALGIESGGTLTKFLVDLEACGFIQQITPISKNRRSLLKVYQIQDPYLNFYFSFIQPNLDKIAAGEFDESVTKPLDQKQYSQWLGYAFERHCRNNTFKIAKLLGFSGVKYDAGTYFSRRDLESGKAGFQCDLVFKRADKVWTICELKYGNSAVDTSVIQDFEDKLTSLPLKPTDSVQRVLISAAGISPALEERHYFDATISLEDLIK